MESLDDQLVHTSEQVRRCRADGDSDRLCYWYARSEQLLDALYAQLHGIDQAVSR
jgi:hypothetical protein